MAITVTEAKNHWNYFLALERDMELVSRYVEFSNSNFEVFSVELAHLLFAASSEVDVLAKLICKQVSPNANPDNINGYKPIILQAMPDLPDTEVFVPRYGLSFKPWLKWTGTSNPDWWRSYNKVKHERDAYFNQATLKNSLNALGALLLLTFHYYSRKLAKQANQPLSPRDTTRLLEPESNLLRLNDDCYYGHLLIST